MLRPTLISILCICLLFIGFYMDKLQFKFVLFTLFFGIGSVFLVAPINWTIHLFVIYLGVEGFAKLMTNYNPIIHVGSDILIISLWIRILLTVLIQRKSLPIRYPPLTSLFLIHAIWFVITITNPSALSLLASLAGAKLYLTIVSLYFFGYYLTTDVKKIKSFMIPWIVIAALQIGPSLYQSYIGPSSVTSLSPNYVHALEKYKGYAFRPFGLTSQPGFPGIYIYISFLFLLHFIFYSRSLLISLGMIFLLPGAIVTLFVCQVRSALLKTILGSIAFLLPTIKKIAKSSLKTKALTISMVAAATMSILIASPILINKVSEGNKDNLRAVNRTLTLFDYNNVSKARSGAMNRFITYAEMVPFGAGLSRIGAAAGKFQELLQMDRLFGVDFFSDNLWIELLIDLGIPGLIIINLIIFMILKIGITGFFTIKDPELKALQWTVLCSLCTILIGAYGAEPILYNPEGPFFWFFSGMLVRIPKLDQEKEELS